MSFQFVRSPQRVPLFTEKQDNGICMVQDVKITDFVCGNNHTVAIDTQKRAFSWGFGGFGRLGHAEQKDEMVPRFIRKLQIEKHNISRVFCGATISFVSYD